MIELGDLTIPGLNDAFARVRADRARIDLSADDAFVHMLRAGYNTRGAICNEERLIELTRALYNRGVAIILGYCRARNGRVLGEGNVLDTLVIVIKHPDIIKCLRDIPRLFELIIGHVPRNHIELLEVLSGVRTTNIREVLQPLMLCSVYRRMVWPITNGSFGRCLRPWSVYEVWHGYTKEMSAVLEGEFGELGKWFARNGIRNMLFISIANMRTCAVCTNDKTGRTPRVECQHVQQRRGAEKKYRGRRYRM
jgi:hypothetical protein